MGDDLARLAAEGQIGKVKQALLGHKQDKAARKIQDAVVAAAAKNQLEVMKFLLGWGAPATAKDLRDARAITLACSTGSLELVQVMLQFKADANEKDKVGRTPMSAAIDGPYLEIVKELVMAGAEAPEECSVRGVGQAVWEARLESMTKQMKNYADIKVSQPEISAAEDKVWIAMREHMRLLEMKEEKAAGDMLLKMQSLTRSEEDESRRSELKVEAMAEELNTAKVTLSKEMSHVRDLILDMDGLKNSHAQLQEEDERIRAEIQERQSELEVAQASRNSAQVAMKSTKSDVDQFNAEVKSLEDEITTSTERSTNLARSLKAAEAELAGWLRDKQTAAELTAQAHRLLGP